MRLGYLAFCVDDQAREARMAALRRYACERVFVDEQPDLASPRPKFREMMEVLSPGDTLIIWQLRHFGLKMREVVCLIDDFELREIKLVSIRDQIDTRENPAIGLFCRVLFELDTSVHRARTKSGLRTAAGRGTKIGRPTVIGKDERVAIGALVDAGVPKRRIARELFLSRSTLERYLRANKAAPNDG